MCRISLLIALGLLVCGAGLPAHAASFDCRRAIEPDEVAICRNADLSELDTEMGALWFAYSKFPLLMGASGARQDDASNFLRRRGACGGNVTCLFQVYQARIATLRNDIAQATSNVQP